MCQSVESSSQSVESGSVQRPMNPSSSVFLEAIHSRKCLVNRGLSVSPTCRGDTKTFSNADRMTCRSVDLHSRVPESLQHEQLESSSRIGPRSRGSDKKIGRTSNSLVSHSLRAAVCQQSVKWPPSYANWMIGPRVQNYRIRQAVGVSARMRELENFGRM